MNKELIELQRNSKATAVVILNEEYKSLNNSVVMKANVKDEILFNSKTGNPVFKQKLNEKAKSGEISYLVIYGIDEISEDMQERFLGIVKDREFDGYYLPENCIVVFTVKNKASYKKISKELYHFCVIA